MNYDYAIHSDFLIHWTGKDIDSVYDQQWYESDSSKTRKSCDVTDRYLKRLFDILEYGIWMTSEKETPFCINGTSIFIPSTPRSCFTELKLSQSRQHARLYGRLGIGFKRPFVIWRQGRPVIYYGFHKGSTKDIFIEQCVLDITNKDLLNFFKPMSSGSKLNYDFYSESEWRILFIEELLKNGLIKNPRDPKNEKEYSYFQKLTSDEQNKLEYLIPLDKWFTMIIYPSHDIKDKAQNELQGKMRDLINEIKKRPNNGRITVESSDWPIELYLDACSNF
jgi:hypothetical protein